MFVCVGERATGSRAGELVSELVSESETCRICVCAAASPRPPTHAQARARARVGERADGRARGWASAPAQYSGSQRQRPPARTHACTHTHSRTHARTHTSGHTHTHTPAVDAPLVEVERHPANGRDLRTPARAGHGAVIGARARLRAGTVRASACGPWVGAFA